MLNFKNWPLCLLLLFLLTTCTAQSPSEFPQAELSEDFDRSPPTFYKMPKRLSARDTCPGWWQYGQRIVLTGIVYASDGQTPAAGVILYYYHTDPQGRYALKPDEARNMPRNKRGQTHGYLRGWVRTNADGRYAIYTQMPGSYPGRDVPAHVHVNIMEPAGEDPYYIDDFVFDQDELLTAEKRSTLENRGGSGIIRFAVKDDVWIGERNIVLGLNVTDE